MRNAVVIIGSGLMGSGIAAVSALHFNRTILVDVDLKKAKAGVRQAEECIRELYENHLVETIEGAFSMLEPSSQMDGALSEAALVIEAVPEKLELKQDVFAHIDDVLPKEIPVLSNTSGLRITDIASRMGHPERAVTAHFWYPAHLVPLVEVVMGDKSSEEMALHVKSILTSWGKAPVLVRRDLPGQLANRILQAVIREASNIVETGLASPEDVDMAVKMGMGIRFPVWGPLEHVDAVGVDLCTRVQDSVLPGISGKKEASDLMRTFCQEGRLGYKTGRGFYEWSKKDMKKLEKRRNEFIIYALKKIKEWEISE